MLTVADLAARDQISKQAVSVHVKKLVERHGLRVERDAQGRVAWIDVDQYDALRRKVANPSKAQAPQPPTAAAPRKWNGEDNLFPDSYDEALRQKTWHDAELKRLAVEQAQGRLVDAGEEADGLDRAAALIREAVDRRENEADELA